MDKGMVPANKSRINRGQRIITNRFLEWFLYMIGYAVVLILMSIFFKTLYISNEYFGLYAFLAAVIIYIQNQTIKPFLFYLTLPITSLTLGLFYPVLNVLILYITSFVLGNKFQIMGMFTNGRFSIKALLMTFFIAILISFMNILMEGLIIKPIIKRGKNE